MTATFYLMAALSLWAAYILIWGRVSRMGRVAALVISVVAMPGAFLLDTMALSRPKPVSLEFVLRSVPEADVLGSKLIEGEGIYLWLALPDVPEPRYYVMPWDQDKAEMLQKTLEEAAATNGTVKMRLPFERSLDTREPKFYLPPQPKRPDKTTPPPPVLYEQETQMRKNNKRVVTPRTWARWLRSKSNTEFEYHRGDLGVATGGCSEPVTEAGQRLREIARFIYAASDMGLVHLFQRRIGPFERSYFAVKARPMSKGDLE